VSTGTTRVERALDALRVPAPASMTGRIFTEWVRTEGPVGDLFVASTDRGIAMVTPAEVVDDDADRFVTAYAEHYDRPIVPGSTVPPGLERALDTGDGRRLRYDLRGLSDFEQSVLHAALQIPRGEVRPYAWVAREIGRPRAVRATGSALGRNPVPVLIPCHRVTRSDGLPGNYAYGPALKERLLVAESIDVDGMRELSAAGAHLVGSASTHVVCYPSCRVARHIAMASRRPFRSMASALAAGYRPCENCRPAPVDAG
jgi:methylated-DNA-[protein]-cysteine S-methyltransferase